MAASIAPAQLRIALGRLLALWLSLVACAQEPRPESPQGILLISLDTLRADYLRTYGYERFDTSPSLDAFALESFVFENAIVTEPWTLTSHMSLFTGLHRHRHGVDLRKRLSAQIPTLAERLQARGYRTGAFVDGGHVARRWGFDRGFESYTQVKSEGLSVLAPLAMDWLEEHAEEPFFMFLHTYDVHSQGMIPYYSKSGGRGRFSAGSGSELEAPGRIEFSLRYQPRRDALGDEDVEYLRATYADGVRYTDDEFGRILSFLRESGLLDRTLVIVWSDHGEAIFEHGRWGHGEVYDHTIRVPLMLRFPGLPGGRRIDSVVSTLDLAPTILELVGSPVPSSMEGRSLLPLLRGESGNRIVYSVRDKRGERRFSARSRDYHLIWHALEDRWFFFDIVADPKEVRDLHPSGSAEEVRLRQGLEAWVAEYDAVSRGASPGETIPLDSDKAEELRALGYVE